MNILVLTFSFPQLDLGVYDGRFVLSEALALAQAGAKVRVLTPYFRGCSVNERIGENLEVIRFKYLPPLLPHTLKRPGKPIYRASSLWEFIQIPLLCICFMLNAFRYSRWAHIIHAQWTLNALLALPAKLIFKKKLVVTARGTDLATIPIWLNQLIHYQVDAAIDCFGPQPFNDIYKKTYSAQFIRLPLIVHVDPVNQMPDDMKSRIKDVSNTFIVLYVGRFDILKLETNKLPIFGLIEATYILRQKRDDFHVFYVGSGDPKIERRMEALVEKYDLTSTVTFLGSKTRPYDYMKFCHLGIGGIALNAVCQEYTVLGKPQILMETPDNKDTPWRHMENAIFVRPDSPDDLAEKILWGMRNPFLLEEIGKRAKESMKGLIVDSAEGGKYYLIAFQKLVGFGEAEIKG